MLCLPLRTVPPTIPLCHLYYGWPAKIVSSYLSHDSGINESPQNTKTSITTNWKSDWPRMCLNIVFEMMYSSRECGFRSNNYSVGGSVASASEARVSIMRLIHNIWIGFRIYCLMTAAPIKVVATATTLTHSWNWMNFLIASYMFLPQSTAFTIELKLSSKRMMAAD